MRTVSIQAFSTLKAVAVNQAVSRLATYRAIAKKYPEIEPDRLLGDLIASTPGDEGRWFATARSLGRLDLAIPLARPRGNAARATAYGLRATTLPSFQM